MRAEIISIGTELLLGHIVNTNASYLSEKLAELGIDVYYHTTVGDNRSRLAQALKQALTRSDIVITSGGLGPTVDDITTETVSVLIGKPAVLNKTILKDLREYFKVRKYKFPPENVRQAYIPEGAKWVKNRAGTAPGLFIEYEGKTIICLPGPPREIVPIFERDVIPYIKKLACKECDGRAHFSVPYAGTWTIRSRTIKTTGLAESQVNGMVKDLLNLKPPTTVGIYAKLKEVDLKIMTKAESKIVADRAINKIENKIRARLKDHIFGYDDETLEDTVANILFKKKKTIAVAESCTGGLISNRLTDVSGSSKYFIMGIIAYSNLVKIARLGVRETTLKKYGAVSRNVAIEMAEGIRRLAGSDIGMGITGIAGPAGGKKSKPVGLVYIAIAKRGQTQQERGQTQSVAFHEQGLTPLVKEFRFKGSRLEIKFQASQAALDLLRLTVVGHT